MGVKKVGTMELQNAREMGQFAEKFHQLEKSQSDSIELQRETLKEMRDGFADVDKRLDALEKSDAARTAREEAGSGGFFSSLASIYRDASPAKKAALWAFIGTSMTGIGSAAREALMLLLGS